MRKSKNAAEVFLGLLLASVFLYLLDPIIASVFAQALTDPNFANSPAGGIWKLMEVLSDFNMEILLAWIAYFAWLFEKI